MENEIWKDVLGYEGIYQCSSLGRVKSLSRIDKSGHNRKEIIRKLHSDEFGYLRVPLYKDGKCKNKQVHRLVWETFNGKIPEDMQVNHINEIKSDNRLSNLNLMTCKENINWGTGIERGHNTLKHSGRCKPIIQYTKDGEFVKRWNSAREASRELGYRQSAIYSCVSGKQLINSKGCTWIPKSAYGYVWKYERG